MLTNAATSAQDVFHMRSVEEVDRYDVAQVCASLDMFRDEVETRDLIPDSALVVKLSNYPIDRLAANVLRASAVSPVFELPERMELIRTWARAFSSGPTPYMPTERHAMQNARGILDDAINEGHVQSRVQNRAYEVTDVLFKMPLGRLALLSTPKAAVVTARTIWRRRSLANTGNAA